MRWKVPRDQGFTIYFVWLLDVFPFFLSDERPLAPFGHPLWVGAPLRLRGQRGAWTAIALLIGLIHSSVTSGQVIKKLEFQYQTIIQFITVGSGGPPPEIFKMQRMKWWISRHIFPELRWRLRLVLPESWVIFKMRVWHLKNCISESVAARNFRFSRKSYWKIFFLSTRYKFSINFSPPSLPFSTSVNIFFYNFLRP